jgi:hypothetical protein
MRTFVHVPAEAYIDVIDEIFNYPGHYTGFAIKPSGGTVRMLAYKFNLTCQQVIVILNQMLADEQLRPVGVVGFDQTYAPIKE